jgi:hypothetical protein
VSSYLAGLLAGCLFIAGSLIIIVSGLVVFGFFVVI